MGQIQHLNYSRQMAKQFLDMVGNGIPFGEVTASMLQNYIDLARRSVKFILPDNGRILDDSSMSALDEKQPLRLPYPVVCIEYRRKFYDDPNAPGVQPTKGLAFAAESNGGIEIYPAVWLDARGVWGPMPPALIESIGHRRINGERTGPAGIAMRVPPGIPAKDYSCETGALLDLLNVLACSNAYAHVSPARSSGRRCKSAIPFDDYRIIKIAATSSGRPGARGGLHRSPREHLRRGHIRRLSSGKCVWVNATIVAAGKDSGRVFKHYSAAS